ncbi:hypothetical protein N7536_011236 [Penicillium majusculum]|uniref:Yeast cell wall synthesis Kre9/Knh1-like N-terminal domain-containing protein n=1 Tax=Penicillium solitum TaxID=60172 RepID=A0A1V6QGF2_9EURO|nr:uncharacterized protein PENSOL_c074G08354 [Penicillium solitum]KAJ5680097.1 hypothetical protein N7536_011236 [Penicillium majusculum]OQD87976.1 hypothetical protein PENSOL_c074G08354 [Penicillium solitum]
MHFSQSLIAVTASLVSFGLAADPLSFTSWPKDPLEPGKPVTLTWTGADPDVPVTILLRTGTSGALQDVKPITTSSKGGSFTWTPDSDVKSGDTYAFQISQKDQTNYTALLKSAGKPGADVPEANETTSETGTAASTAEATGTTTGATTGTTTGTSTDTTTGTTDTTSAPSTSTTGGTTEATQTTQTTMTSTTSKALISTSASASGSPSSSAVASSTDSLKSTSTEDVNGKEASSTTTSQTGAASIPQYSVQLVMGIVGLLAYLV